VDNKSKALVLNNPDNNSLKESMSHTNSNLRNSFVDIYHWVQGELYDIQALADAVNSRTDLEKNLLSLQKKKTSAQKDIDDLNAGNKTVGTMFKNKDDIGKLTREIDGLE